MGGFGLGGSLPAPLSGELISVAPFWSKTLARTSAVLPVLFAVGPGTLVWPVWLGIFSGGMVAGSLEAGARHSRIIARSERPDSVAVPLTWTGPALLRITGWPSAASGDRWRSPARILDFLPDQMAFENAPLQLGRGVMVAGKGDPPELGALVTGLLELSPPPSANLPGAFDYRLFLAGRGLAWKGKLEPCQTLPSTDLVTAMGGKIFTPLRRGLASRINENLPTVEARMASAILLGIRDQNSRQASRPFADLGLAHLFAVSGLHVGILLGIILLPAKWAGFPAGWKVGPLLVLLPTYVLITGMPGSVVRAASLGFLTLLATALGKPSHSMRLIGLLFWAGTIWDPFQNLDVGLKLSYLAAGGILGVSSLTNGFKFSRHLVIRTGCTGLAVCAAAQWFTLPVVAGAFGRISLLSPLANLIAVPLFGLAVWCVVLSVAVGSFWSGGAEAAAALGWLLLRFLAGLAGSMSRSSAGFPLGLPVPGLGALSAWVVLTAAGILVLLRHGAGMMPGRRALLLVLATIALGLFLFGPFGWNLRSPSKITAWQFDVGQGDCSFLVFPDGWSVLIDTGGRFGFSEDEKDGPFSRTVLPFLRRSGLTKIDSVILTHGHLDHTGGAVALAEALQVERWYVSGRGEQSLAAVVDTAAIVRPGAGHLLHRWHEWELALVYPAGELPGHLHENDRSLVVVLRRDGRDMAVWSGDLELAGEQLMLAAGRAPRDIQVWKAGHHGSDTSGSDELLTRFHPELILLSCGVGNTYGHPSHGTYVARGDTVAIARTDLQGSILMEWDPDGQLRWRSMVSGTQIISLP